MNTQLARSYEKADLAEMFLPIGEMLQTDRVVHVQDGNIVSEKRISPNDWIFALHLPNDPIFPGCLLIEGAGQLMAIWAWHSGLRGNPRLVKVSAEFKSPVLPSDECITYKGELKKRNNIVIGRVEISVHGRYVGAMEGSLIVLRKPQ